MPGHTAELFFGKKKSELSQTARLAGHALPSYSGSNPSTMLKFPMAWPGRLSQPQP